MAKERLEKYWEIICDMQNCYKEKSCFEILDMVYQSDDELTDDEYDYIYNDMVEKSIEIEGRLVWM